MSGAKAQEIKHLRYRATTRSVSSRISTTLSMIASTTQPKALPHRIRTLEEGHLKKRKLVLKDQMERIRRRLGPRASASDRRVSGLPDIVAGLQSGRRRYALRLARRCPLRGAGQGTLTSRARDG